jgi:TatD DNase family protein
MTLIDSHAHLTFEVLQPDLEGVLSRAQEAGVEHVITIGTSIEDSKRAVDLARTCANVSATVGVHPHEAAKTTEAELAKLAGLVSAPHVIGIGEIGLDYHYDFSDRASQYRVFEAQLELASSQALPLVIHCREAVEDAVPILSAAGFDRRPVVFHCFTGTQAEADRIAEHGWRISFTGIVTFPRSTELQAIAQVYPADQLMIETDSPYLSPVPVRGVTPNEPAHLVHTARFLADLRAESFDALAAQTTTNTRSFFGLTGQR